MATNAEAQTAGFITPGASSLVTDGDDAISANARAAVDLDKSNRSAWAAAVAGVTEYVGQIANVNTEDLNTKTGTDNGGKARRFLYYVNVGTAVLNMPPNPGSGWLETRVSPNGANFLQTVTYARDPLEVWQRYMLKGSAGAWTYGPWTKPGAGAEYVGQILNTASEDLNIYRPTGPGDHRRYWINGAAVLNLPGAEPWSGILDVWASHNVKVWLQRVTYVKASPEVWERRILDGSAGLQYDPWVRIDKGGADEAAAPQRAALVSAFTARRGGTIGTAGRPVVAFRFDHGLTNFKTKVLPLLRKYGLPSMQTMNARTWGQASNSGMTAAELAAAWLNDAVEVTNHGATHNDGATDPAVRDEIVAGLAELQASFPESVVEGYCPPGVTGTRFQGFDGGDTVGKWYSTLAGRLILQHHAAAFGYLGGIYRPQTGAPTIGATHTTMDTATVADVQAIVRGNNTAAGALTLMLHPVYLDTAGYMTTAQLEEILSYVAAFRDAGTLEVLTPTGSLLADPTTSYRHDLLNNGQLRNGLSGWTGTGWTTTTGNGITWAATAGTVGLSQSVSLSRLGHVRGSAREFVVTLKASATATVTLAVGNGGQLNASRTVTVGTAPADYRLPFTIPTTDGTAVTVTVTRASGGTVSVTNLRARTI